MQNKCKGFRLTPGRVIVCSNKKINSNQTSFKGSDEKEIFSINKLEGFSPTEADAMAHYLVDKLNKKNDFGKYYKEYMK